VVLTDHHNGSDPLDGTAGAGSVGVHVITLVATNDVGTPVKQTFGQPGGGSVPA
jgi:hypothetical protein